MRVLALTVVVFLGCSRTTPVPPVAQASASLEPGASGTVSAATALITAQLHPDGTVDLLGVSVRPIRFGARGLAPWDAERMSVPDSAKAPPESDTAQRDPMVLVVRANELTAPVVVPVDLGHPAEGGGDVADRWNEGTVILRAPHFGATTEYALMQLRASGTVRLGQWKGQP